jgi:MarR family transcriptional regulator, transcriptional regulator for hemolysin
VTSTLPPRASPDISFMLAHASHVLATRMTAAFSEIGLTPRGFCVLAHAMAAELTQIELARLSDLDKTTMVLTLDELEHAGYAERRPSPADRRARIVTVTPAGRRIAAAGQQIADRVHREVLDALPPGERDAFLSGLTRLVGGLLAVPAGPRTGVRRARQARGQTVPASPG